MEEKAKLVNPVSAQVNLTSQKLNLINGFLNQTVYKDWKIKIFRTAQDTNNIEDTTIGSYVTHQSEDWGHKLTLSIGSMGPENINRSLLLFRQIAPGFLKDKKILAAVIYLRQAKIDNFAEEDAAWNETINVYATLKKWHAGNDVRCKVDKGETCWLSARSEVEDWLVPGCGSENNDFDPEVLATSGPVVAGNSEEWVPVVFTAAGIEKLKSQLIKRGALEYGFLLKLGQESKMNSLLSFYSSDIANRENRPYLEIYYLDQ